jgi:mycobactin peptide synthetase MbtE
MQTIHGCFRECARRRPASVAVRQGNQSMTYAALDTWSDRIAGCLHDRGVRPGDIVPVLLDRSITLVAVLLGILKSGAAYAALDASWPDEHLAGLLRRLDGPLVVAVRPYRDHPTWIPSRRLPADRPVPVADTSGQDPCCVFFSSGTTGEPKGALVPHDGTVRLLRDASFATLGPGAAMPQAAPLPWDGFTLELWSMLITGGTALLLEQAPLTSSRLRRCVARGATLAWTTTSIFNLLVDEDIDCFAGLGQVLVGGERLSPPHVGRFLARHPDIRLTNGYGPVEATVFVTTHDIGPDDPGHQRGIPIGTALPDTDLLVLDGDQLCGEGQAGELCVAGPRLALGYLGGVSGGFTRRHGGAGPRLYRTGDLVVRQGELLYFAGRKDRQVKVRGHRVEPQELEATAMRLPGMRRCAVVALTRPAGRVALALFYSAGEDARLTPQDVGEHLRRLLPDYAVPQFVREVDGFPLTASGKLDERALTALLKPGEAGDARGQGAPAPESAEEATELEQLIAKVMASVLGVERLAAGTGLHALGATSLDLIRGCMRLEREFGLRVPAQLPGGDCDIRELAAAIAEAQEPGPGGGPPPGRPEYAALTPVAASFVAQQEIMPDDTSALCPMRWHIHGPLDISAVELALRDVWIRHESLRAAYRLAPEPVAVPGAVRADDPVLTLMAAAATLDDAGRIADDWLYREPARLLRGRPWDAALVRIGAADGSPAEHLLGIVVHHACFDGWSASVFARDLTLAYNARHGGRAPQFDAPAPAQADLAADRARRDAPVSRADSFGYWQAALQGSEPLRLRAGQPADATDPPAGANVIRTGPLSAGDVERWRRLAHDNGTTLFAALLAVYARCLGRYLADPDVVIGVPVVVRETAREETAIACLINMLGLRVYDPAATSWGAAVAAASLELERALRHRRLGFPDLIRHLHLPWTGRTPVYQTICVLQDNEPPDLDLDGCVSEFSRPHPPNAVTELVAEFCPGDGGALHVEVTYQLGRIPPDVANRLASDLVTTLAEGPAVAALGF